MEFSPQVRPVCLPTKSEGDLVLADLPALVLGWGVTRDQVEPQLSRTLQEAQVSGETLLSLGQISPDTVLPLVESALPCWCQALCHDN